MYLFDRNEYKYMYKLKMALKYKLTIAKKTK